MSRVVRCRHCGSGFVPDRPAPQCGPRRRCPRCRGPLTSIGGVQPSDLGRVVAYPMDADR